MELNLPHHLNYVATQPCKMHSAHCARETVDFPLCYKQKGAVFFDSQCTNVPTIEFIVALVNITIK